MTYTIMRFYKSQIPSKIIHEGLTLIEAQEYCQDKETSSKTCENQENINHTELYGAWLTVLK